MIDYLKSIVPWIGYKLLYVFSYFQIKIYNNALLGWNRLLKDTYSTKDKDKDEDEDEDKLYDVDLFDGSNIITKNYSSAPIVDGDYIVVIKKNPMESDPTNRFLCKCLSDRLQTLELLNWERTTYDFIHFSVNFTMEDGRLLVYDVPLKSRTYNYYIVGNIIDEKFIQYYLKKHLNVNILENVDDFCFEIMSSKNMKLHKCNEIHLLKDDFLSF
jgi:hypothetical protein